MPGGGVMLGREYSSIPHPPLLSHLVKMGDGSTKSIPDPWEDLESRIGLRREGLGS